METIDAPQVGLRLVTTYDDTTRRIDVALRGSQGLLVEDGVATPFPVEQLWPVLRELLPPLDQLRADPPPHRVAPGGPPGPDFVEACRAMVVLATVVGGAGETAGTEQVSVRTWLATTDELWSVTPGATGNEVRRAEPGSVAELLVWDVTGAMESLVRLLEAAS